MSCSSTALSVFFLLFGVQSIDLTHALPLSSLPGFDLPEIDGSSVDICRIFPAIPDATTTTTTTTTTTRKQVVATTKKPAIQSPPRKPEIKKAGTPIRPQPAPAGPITDGLSNPAARRLYYLLANSRGHAAASLPRFNNLISDSDESAAALAKRAGRTDANRWKMGSFSSEDSSDES